MRAELLHLLQQVRVDLLYLLNTILSLFLELLQLRSEAVLYSLLLLLFREFPGVEVIDVEELLHGVLPLADRVLRPFDLLYLESQKSGQVLPILGLLRNRGRHLLWNMEEALLHHRGRDLVKFLLLL